MKTAQLIYVILFLICSSTVHAQLSGSYSINSALSTGGANYQTFTAFANDINAVGVTGNVTATVVPGSGPYMEQVVFSNIPGAGPAATVTLEGNGETISAITNTNERHIVRLSDVQYFTINNLHVAWNAASSGGFYGIHIYNSGNHITISHCSVDISGTSSTLYGAYVASGSLTSILDSGAFSNISFLNDTATGGGYGASVFGFASSLAYNIVISGNVFYDFHSNGVYLRETNGAEISGNHFDKRTSNVTTVNAIQIAQNANINASVFNNYIRVSQTSNGSQSFRGICLFNGTGHKVYNNVICNMQLTSVNITGIEVRSANTALEIANNTISIDNTSSASGNLYGIKEELSNTLAILRNNLVSISQSTSGQKAGLVLGATAAVTTAFNSDYNLFWVPGGNVALKSVTSPVLYATLISWQAASTQDAHSVSIDPLFVSFNLPVPTNVVADNLGTPVAGVTTDILGVARGVIPDIGAYEFPTTVGINPVPSTKNLAFYPNPFSNKVIVDLFIDAIAEITLYNAMGQLQVRHAFSKSVVLNTEHLAAGIYFYEIRSEQTKRATGKIIKQ